MKFHCLNVLALAVIFPRSHTNSFIVQSSPKFASKTALASTAPIPSSLLHKVPDIEKIATPPQGANREALTMKEVKLPYAEQTHEVCYEPLTGKIFVTQMTNSHLVKIGVDSKGTLRDDHEAYSIGTDNAGLHNCSPSYKYPGCVWLSLQYMNLLMLVDVQNDDLEVKQIYKVPSEMKDPETGDLSRVGGPHCMRECRTTGHIWAGLKGALEHGDDNACGKISQCCCPDKLKEGMEEHGIEVPNSYAVWQLDPAKYDPKAPDGSNGGKLYPCRNSPPMLCTDLLGNAWIPQDQSDTLQFIDAKKQVSEQLEVPWPKDCADDKKKSGPGISMAPDGSIWMVQLQTDSSIVRIDPVTKERTLYEFETPTWAKMLRLIHLDFPPPQKEGAKKRVNRIYAIATTLLNDDSIDALLILDMCDSWQECNGIRIVPLPSQKSACHRIAFCEDNDDDDDTDDGSVFITELKKSKILQVKVNNDIMMTEVEEKIDVDEDGFTHRKYHLTSRNYFDDEAFKKIE